LLRQYNAQATFFILGKVAERRPELVEAVYSEGHEIASHGYSHRPVDELGRIGFEEDLLKSKTVLENIVPTRVLGHRARSFSIGTLDHWALEIMARNGFLYDSSILSSKLKNHITASGILKLHDNFYEVSPSSRRFMGWHMTIGGGTFFRFIPLSAIRLVAGADTNLVTYAHAWEFNRNQPNRRVSFIQALSQSPLFYTTPKKLESLLKHGGCMSIAEVLAIQ
jgi:polysaccharide deacetylase family protein (PEP-CTERM system associated)